MQKSSQKVKKYLVLLLLLLSGCGKKVEPPAAYVAGEDSVPALSEQMSDESFIFKQNEKESPNTFSYQNLEAAGTVAKDYAKKLTEEEGFSVVDDAGAPTEMPDFSAENGTVLLYKPSSTEGELFTLKINWTQDECDIAVEQKEGSLKAPEQEDEGMTLSEVVAYLKGLKPSQLKLPGKSMSEYAFCPISGIVMVDHTPCIQISVYPVTDPQQTRKAHGIFLIDGARKHLYHVDGQDNSITVLQ